MHGSESQTQTPTTAPRICDPTCTELTVSGHTASSSVAASNYTPADSFQTASASAAAPDSAAAQTPSALRGAVSVADTNSTADHAMSASTQANHDSSSLPHSAVTNKAVLFSQARPSSQKTILVEAIIPDHQLATNSCHAPCLLNLSVTPQALASYHPGSTCASAAFPEGIDAQRALAEGLVQQHMHRSEPGSTPIQLSSSIKVSHH